MEMTIAQALQKAGTEYKNGNFRKADVLYSAILKSQPKHPAANHNMGVLAVSVGKIETALPFFKTALEANPSNAQFWVSYADALIKVQKFADARTALDQAKSNGAVGAGLDKLVKKLNSIVNESEKDKLEYISSDANVLDTINLDKAIKLAKRKERDGALEEAKQIYEDILVKFPKNKKANYGLKVLSGSKPSAVSKVKGPPQDQVQLVINLYGQGKFQQALERIDVLVQKFSSSANLLNIQGVILKRLSQLDRSIVSYNKALAINPDYADAHFNIGNALAEKGQLEEAIIAYKKALAIKPDFAAAQNNIGNVLREQGDLDAAIQAYNRALTIKPNSSEAHRNLSFLTNYNPDNVQISQVRALLQQVSLNEADRCNLLYAHAKMQEDIGDFSSAFDSYVTGGNLRKKLLGYEFAQDERLFSRIKQTASYFEDIMLKVVDEPITPKPIFILGMPRSGTTLVEQIISSHSEVMGAGELDYVVRFGHQLAAGSTEPKDTVVMGFRERYLSELARIADGQAFITDKMPQNFLYIALICAAFPEAKIIHVQRTPQATCWSNFKHYFGSKNLGYSYNLQDTVKYYSLYTDLMHFWNKSYRDRIYNINYDKLTEHQKLETRKLIEALKLDWEDACLSPQENKRLVKTASQLQVKQKVYKGSSQDWRKYEPFLDGVFDELNSLSSKTLAKVSNVQNPPQHKVKSIINLYEKGQLQQALKQLETLIEQFPKSDNLFNIQGAIFKGIGKLELSVQAFKTALAAKPDFAEAYNNMGTALKEQGKMEEAIDAFTKAVAIMPEFAEAHFNMGNALKEQDKLDGAIEAYKKTLVIRPNFADAYFKIGNVLKDQDKLDEAIEAYSRALVIRPDFIEASINIGVTLQEQGEIEKAIKAYTKTLAIKPDFAEAHLYLSRITNYEPANPQIGDVEGMLKRPDLSNSDRCCLLYTHAKMQDDIGDLSTAFADYVAAGQLRQKSLGYKFSQDEELFAQILKTAPQFKGVVLNATEATTRHTPIFIIGMPRSGTTLVEQIISSHSEVMGAGELRHVSKFGHQLATGVVAPSSAAVSEFQERYLTALSNKANGHIFVTDKMPQNFKYIPLICNAFPTAKIIHVKRNPEATCWSSFTHYFFAKDLGYSFNLEHTIQYYLFYKDLMHFWEKTYGDRIYNLNYEKLTEDQELETRKLTEYLGLEWQEACLSPHKNKRSVKTASQYQVRQQIYRGSSETWRKYEPLLDGVFDRLKA